MTESFSEFRLEPEVPLGQGIHMDQRGVVSERNNDVKTFVGIEAVS